METYTHKFKKGLTVTLDNGQVTAIKNLYFGFGFTAEKIAKTLIKLGTNFLQNVDFAIIKEEYEILKTCVYNEYNATEIDDMLTDMLTIVIEDLINELD